MKQGNEREEAELRKKFKQVSSGYQNNMQDYDREVQTATIENKKSQEEYEDVYNDLQETKEEYNMRLQEKKKRDEIEAFMRKKDDEQKS